MAGAGAVSGIEPVELEGLSDGELLGLMAADAQRSAFYAARSAEAIERFRRRRQLDHRARQAAGEAHGTLTPTAETVVEVGPLVGADAGRVRGEVARTKTLLEDFSEVWELCRTGQLDMYKARVIAETAMSRLEATADVRRLSKLMADWLTACLPADRAGQAPLITKTVKQIRNRVNYLLARMKTRDADARFQRSYARRGVRLVEGEDGMGWLSVNHTGPHLQACEHRLTALARQLRGAGDERTLAQLRADTLVDLILGRLVLTSPDDFDSGGSDGSDGSGECGGSGPGRCGAGSVPGVLRVPTPTHARPVINVTVPIQTLMGLSEEPGVAAGGSVVPAALARLLARDPDSTWYRMLTDPARRCMELSTKAYQPTDPIWREVVAAHQACYHPSCSAPASTVEIDHRVRRSRGGRTATGNLAPACKRDHVAKDADGFSLQRLNDGRLVFTTRTGQSHPVELPEQPVGDDWPPEWLFLDQTCPAEIRDTLYYLRHLHQRMSEPYADWVRDHQWRADRATDPDLSDADYPDHLREAGFQPPAAETGPARPARWGNRDAEYARFHEDAFHTPWTPEDLPA